MREQSAAEAAHAHARAVVAGDYSAMIRAMTPEALAKAMAVGNTTWKDISYDLVAQDRDGPAYVFDVTYHTDLGPLTLRERFREIDGEWKMVDIERVS